MCRLDAREREVVHGEVEMICARVQLAMLLSVFLWPLLCAEAQLIKPECQ